MGGHITNGSCANEQDMNDVRSKGKDFGGEIRRSYAENARQGNGTTVIQTAKIA